MAISDQEDGETVRVTITGHGIELARDVEIGLLPRLIALLVGRGDDVVEPTNTLHTSRTGIQSLEHDVSRAERPVGPVEYIREKKPQTSSDTILVLAAYLELHERRRPFSRDDLRRLMRSARLPEPANFPRDLGVAVSKGYIQALDDGFQLTNTALELIGQPGPLVPSRGHAPRRRRPSQARDEES